MIKPNPFMAKALEKTKAEQRAKQDNPFLRPPKGKETIKALGLPRLTEDQWEELRVQSRRLLAEANIKVGDEVKITWEYDRAYGPGTAKHHGIVAEISDVLRCEPASTGNGKLILPLTAVKSIARVEKKQAKPNPFMKATE